MKTTACMILLLGSFAACISAGAAPSTAEMARRDALLKDPDLLRYYSFDTGAASSPDLAGKGGPLQFAPAPAAGATPETLKVIEGRRPGTKAVRLNAGALVGPGFDLPDRAFTVEAWIRKMGPGLLHGNSEATNGELLSLGGGYWDGWRLTTTYPERTLGFELGRPQPSSSVGIGTQPVSDGTWRHLAATWDGHEMRVYLDGLLAASGKYEGDFTPASQDRQFRVGYAGYGFGSVQLDVDEVTAWRRARTAAEIVEDASGGDPLPLPAVERFNSAAQHTARKEAAPAAADYTAILALPDIPANGRVTARLGLGDALRADGKWAPAAMAYAQALQATGAPEGLRGAAADGLIQALPHAPAGAIPQSVFQQVLAMKEAAPEEKRLARLAIARTLRQGGDTAGATQEYARVLESPGLPMRERLDIRLELGDSLLEAGLPVPARVEYTRVVAADSPAEYRSLAAIRIGQAYVQQKDYTAATTAFSKVAEMAGAPAHMQWVAGERLREVARLQKGFPARDPAWSRVHLPPDPQPAITLYVAPGGADANPGTRGRPFATLSGARDALRAIKARGPLPQGGAAVLIRGGQYLMKETLALTEGDSGSSASPIVYRAAPGETVRLTGGVQLAGFEPVQDAALLARLPEGARSKAMQLNLRAMGITDYGQVAPAGKRPELFFNGKPMPLARYPNEGFLKVGDLVGGQLLDTWAGKGSSVGKFTYEGSHADRWKAESDLWTYGYWFWDWADAYGKVESIDTGKHVISLAPPYHNYGYRTGQRYYVVNAFSEIDTPGEWYLDRQSGILYFYPPSDPARAVVELSMLGTPLVRMENVSHVTLQGLTLEDGRESAVEINNSDHCLVEGCAIRRFGGDGVIIDGGSNCGLLGCDVYTLGRGGARVSGGARKTLTPGGHFVENCRIYDFSRIDRTYTPAVWLDGVENRIAHNVFHDSPHHAMRIEGNDHVIEFNEIYNVVYEADDQGGLDMWFNPAYRGNVIRYNYWHDIGSGLGLGQAGIRLDDAISGVTIYGNVFYRCSGDTFGGVQIHGGQDNVLDNNLFVECKHAISFSPWGEARWKKFLRSPEVVKATRQDVDITTPPYSTRYPELAHIEQDTDRNFIWRNLVVDCGDFLLRDPGLENLVDNHPASPPLPFADRAHGNLALDRAVYTRLGMDPIPFSEIGLYGARRGSAHR